MKENNIPLKTWRKAELRDLLFTIAPPIKLNTSEYLVDGKYPIVDQGKNKIVGYTNNDAAVLYNLPAVIFGDHTKEVKFINFPFAVGADGVKILDSDELEKTYLKFVIENAVKYLPDLGYSRYFSELKNVVIAFPSKAEQKAIAKILSTVDAVIHITEIMIAQKELRKKWLMQQLLTGRKRLKGFENTKWKMQPLENFIKPIVREVPKPDVPYIGIGLRSHGKGTFLKHDEQPEKNSMDNFYVVRPNDLIVNITFAWEQAIAIVRPEDDGALASHRFPTYTFIEEKGHPDFFRFFILQARMKFMLEIISPGGAGRNRVMSKSDFIKLEFLLPEYKEQTAIAQVLQAADKEISLLKLKAEKLREKKKGLMQQLLTGKIRVK